MTSCQRTFQLLMRCHLQTDGKSNCRPLRAPRRGCKKLAGVDKASPDFKDDKKALAWGYVAVVQSELLHKVLVVPLFFSPSKDLPHPSSLWFLVHFYVPPPSSSIKGRAASYLRIPLHPPCWNQISLQKAAQPRAYAKFLSF